MHYLLFYKTVENYVEKRAPYREQHLKTVREAHARGEILLAGAYAEPADGALLVFKADSPKVAEDFAKNDIYVQQGLITAWQVRPWTVVVP